MGIHLNVANRQKFGIVENGQQTVGTQGKSGKIYTMIYGFFGKKQVKRIIFSESGDSTFGVRRVSKGLTPFTLAITHFRL